MKLLFSPAALALAPAVASFAQTEVVPPPVVAPPTPVPVDPLPYRVIARYPHDPAAFTEGLLLHHGRLYESTGLEGASDIREVRLSDGKVLRSARVPGTLFGEGIVGWRNELLSVTWKTGQGFRWSLPALKQTGSLRYAGEGWGMTSTGKAIILSDGTPQLRFLDPESFKVTRTLTVTANGKPLRSLNELEWVDGAMFANVWRSHWIVRIDPASGAVTGAIDIDALTGEAGGDYDRKTPNGIAWDKDKRLLYVTGKNWPTLFALSIDPVAP